VLDAELGQELSDTVAASAACGKITDSGPASRQQATRLASTNPDRPQSLRRLF
jgi:hypothetical protein